MSKISDRGIVASSGAQWNQSRVGDSQYTPATDEEKAAALDAAIEFEDRIDPIDLIDEGFEMTDEAKETLAPVDELLEVGERMKRDKARLVELCRLIAGGEDAVREVVIEASKPETLRRKKVNGVNGVPDSSPGEKIRKEYWRKVACPLCGTQTGAIRKGDGVGTLFTTRHKDPKSGAVCKGCDSPAKIVTETE